MSIPADVQFSSTTKIEELRDIVDEVMKRILAWETWAFISDDSSLFDFPYDELYASEDELFAKVKSEFGVNVTDITDANISKICGQIKLHRLSN